jgi:hypothetical protein
VAAKEDEDAAETSATPINYDEAGQRFQALQLRYFNPEVSREDKRAALGELKTLVSRAQAEHDRLKREGENIAANDMGRLLDAMLNAAKGMAGEVGPLPEGRAESAEPPGLSPIPSFTSPTPASRSADALREAREKFADHWQTKPRRSAFPDREAWIKAQAQWDGQKNKLLLDMMSAEEQLAWDAADPGFTRAEARKLHEPYAALERARGSLDEIRHKERELQKLHGNLAEFSQMYNGLMENVSKGSNLAGMQLPMEELIAVKLAYGRVLNEVNDKEKLLGDRQRALLDVLERLNTSLTDVMSSRRERGIRRIRRLACEQATERGEDTPRPFALHRPRRRSLRRDYEYRLQKQIEDRLSGMSDLPAGTFGDLDSLLPRADGLTRAWTPDERARLVGKGR